MTDEQIFDQVIQLQVGDRAAYMDATCRNQPEQHKRIEALIAAHEQSDSLLDAEAMALPGDTVVEEPIRKTLGDFEIIRELGRGGMGVVYEARQKSLKRTVALKVLSSGLGLSSKAILRFCREAEAAGKLHHTNIVPIYTTGQDRGVHFYAMELIDGPSLDAVIREVRSESNARENDGQSDRTDELPAWVKETALFTGPKTKSPGQDSGPTRVTSSSQIRQSSVVSGRSYFDHVATMIADVAEALDHAHEHGVIHRDIKPSNLLLAPDGRLSVTDFGLARMLEQPGMTMSGEFVGSPLYMSPEQITAGRVSLDHRTDIYSLGATLYELLALQPPFPGQTRDQVLSQILHKDAVSPRKLNRRIPVDLDTICMKAIDKDPDRRYQTAGQLANDLRKYVNRHAISIKRQGLAEKTFRWIRRNQLATAFIAFVVAVLCVGLIAWHLDYEQERRDAILKINDQLYGALMRGDDESNLKALLRELERLEASEQSVRFAEGLIELMRSMPDYEEAEARFAEVVQSDPENIAANAMLAYSIGSGGDEAGQLQILEAIPADAAVTFEEKLFLGFASQWCRPEQAYRLLGQADQEKKNRQFVLVQLGTAGRLYALMVEDDLEKAAAILDVAHENINNAIGVMTPTPQMLGERLLVGIDEMTVHEALAISASDSLERDGHLERASEQRSQVQTRVEEILSETESPHKDLSYAIVHALKQLDQHERLEEVADQWTRINHDIGLYASQDLALHFLSKKEYRRANDWYIAARGRQARQTLFLKTYMQLASSDGSSISDLRSGARLNLDIKSRSDDKSFISFDAILLCLLGDEYGLQLIREDPMSSLVAKGSFDPICNYFSSETRSREDADRLLRECRLGKSANFSLMHANYSLGVEALADGRIPEAKNYLSACMEGRQYALYVYKLSRALIAHENEWPRWIKERQAVADSSAR